MTDEPTEISTEKVIPPEEAGMLPASPIVPPQKDISKTIGGKITDFFINYGIGFGGNVGLSLLFSYGLNPRKNVKTAKDAVAKFITQRIKSANPTATLDSVRSSLEIAFMTIAGFTATIIMTPLMSRREKIAYKINQWLGRDTHVLPEEMRKRPEPTTLEEKIEQEIDKRVNKKHSAGDLWKARFSALGVVFIGDYFINWWDATREGPVKDEQWPQKQSTRTLSWRAGQQIYKKMPNVAKWINTWFKKIGVSIDGIKENMGKEGHYERLEKTEHKYGNGGAINEDRMVMAEQTRLVTKEVAWSLALAGMVDKMTRMYHHRRLKRERLQAIAELKREGIIPQGYGVALEENVKVIKAASESPAAKPGSWAAGKSSPRAVAPSASHMQAAEKGRASEQVNTI